MGVSYSMDVDNMCGTEEDVEEVGPRSTTRKTVAQSMGDYLLQTGVLPLPRQAEEESVEYALTVLGGACSSLEPSSRLKQKLFNWPDSEFSEENCVLARFGEEPHKQMRAGQPAVDFELPRAVGVGSVRLADVLRNAKPVMLCGVTTSCPHCMAFSGAMEQFALDYPEMQCVAVAVVQPHPQGPDPSFETGKVWEMTYSAGNPQPRTLSERLIVAQIIQKKIPSWTVLADDFAQGSINPFWSTYGPAPRAAYLLDDSGLICHSMLWWEPERARKAADAYLNAAGLARGARPAPASSDQLSSRLAPGTDLG